MSIIGTRPPLISETNLYELHHRARLAIKPGITGMWQVSGRSDITDFEEVVRLDKEYITIVIVGLFFYIVNMKQGKFKYKFGYTKFAVLFNIPLIPHYFSEYILNQSDRIMIQKMCSLTDVAFYSVAWETKS